MTDAADPVVVGFLRETFPGERRVALAPAAIKTLHRAGFHLLMERGAGEPAGFVDEEYLAKNVEILDSRDAICERANILAMVRIGGANPVSGRDDFGRLREGQILVGHADPLSEPEAIKELAERKVSAFALELLPRITRAQSMDVLSSMATIAGYKAVLLAADALPRMFPMLMTAAGTVSPAKVFVIGAGVAGLQAIATAKRLGAIVRAYDVRPAVKEQVESLGGKFVELELETKQAEGGGGYAKAMDEEFYERQREMMTKVIAECDVVITTAAIPGKKAPILVTSAMVDGMQPGSIIVDLAAERGGNCELTQAGETIDVHGVKIMGPLNIPSTIPYHASEMYSRNLATFLAHLKKTALFEDGSLNDVVNDEIILDTLVTHGGEVCNQRVKDLLNPSEPDEYSDPPAPPPLPPEEKQPETDQAEGDQAKNEQSEEDQSPLPPGKG